MRVRRARRRLDLRVGGVEPAVADVLGDRSGDEDGLLQHHRDAAAQRVGGVAPHVASVDPDDAGAVLGRATLTLGARQAQTKLTSQWISSLGPSSSGHITISSSPAVIPLAYFGTTDGASLAAIPLQPVDR